MAERANLKFWGCFLWGNGNELRGLRAKFWRGPSYHAKRGFQGYQHVMLSSIVCVRAFPWYKTVLPHYCGSSPCIIAEKALKMPHFSKNPKYKSGGNMRNRLFVPDFYTVKGSIGTPSARSNGRRRPRTCAGQRLTANGSTDTSRAGD